MQPTRRRALETPRRLPPRRRVPRTTRSRPVQHRLRQLPARRTSQSMRRAIGLLEQTTSPYMLEKKSSASCTATSRRPTAWSIAFLVKCVACSAAFARREPQESSSVASHRRRSSRVFSNSALPRRPGVESDRGISNTSPPRVMTLIIRVRGIDGTVLMPNPSISRRG